MNVTHDLIASVQGPGWKYGLSRILIDDAGNGVVFVAGSEEPFAQFEAGKVQTSRGTGTTADGGEVTWRRRGSSCQYKLAKCKISTATITSWWEKSREGDTAEALDKTEETATDEKQIEEVVETASTSDEAPSGDDLDDLL